jgi:hypothetical protein
VHDDFLLDVADLVELLRLEGGDLVEIKDGRISFIGMDAGFQLIIDGEGGGPLFLATFFGGKCKVLDTVPELFDGGVEILVLRLFFPIYVLLRL